MINGLVIDKLLTIDDTGMPKAPTLRQLQDKDVLLLWQRDTSKDKHKYIAEVGVITPLSFLFNCSFILTAAIETK